MKKLILILLCLPFIGFGQIPGCTNSLAYNYNPSATIDDGSCCYGSELTLDINTSDQCGYSYRLGWVIQDANGTTIASGGNQNGETYANNTNYNHDICFEIC